MGGAECQAGWLGKRSIILYDMASGGQATSQRPVEMLLDLLRDCREQLDCKRKCDAACHACLLDYDTQHHASDLNRHMALAWVHEDRFCIASARRAPGCFGPDTEYEARPAGQALLRKCGIRTWLAVWVFLAGHGFMGPYRMVPVVPFGQTRYDDR